jgi:hypothetical protein
MHVRSIVAAGAATGAVAAVCAAVALAATPGPDVRLTNDHVGPGVGYQSDYTLVTGVPYTDATLTECGQSRGRQNEPAVAIDPRNTQVIVGSSNDYCGVYNAADASGPVAAGPIWVGYYRSENAGGSFVSSLMPGYPGDTSPYAARSQLRTASSGDPVLAWDNHGRVFLGTETSEDPAGTGKGFGDQGVGTFENPQGPSGPVSQDGKEFKRAVIVARGSSAPGTGGKFNDKTAIEADRTGGACDANVYFAYSRFTGSSQSNIYFSRSTDHGVSFSKPALLSPSTKSVQGADISVTRNGHVYVTWNAERGPTGADEAVEYAKSTDCGRTFGPVRTVVTYRTYEAQDIGAPTPSPAQARADDPAMEAEAGKEATARDCGDFEDACRSGYTFFRRGTQARSTADQRSGVDDETVYVVYDPSKPGTEVPTGTTYGSIQPGTGSQSGIFFVRLNGANGTVSPPQQIDPQGVGHQLFPDVAIEGGALHVLWWDSRHDPTYSPTRPVGNDAAGHTVPSLETYGTASADGGLHWAPSMPMSDVLTNPDYEQFDNRKVPFAGDYLWISAVGSSAYGTWTDWRNTVAGGDAREAGDSDHDGADVMQCRTGDATSGFSSDQCPRAGGLDQNIYGDNAP